MIFTACLGALYFLRGYWHVYMYRKVLETMENTIYTEEFNLHRRGPGKHHARMYTKEFNCLVRMCRKKACINGPYHSDIIVNIYV